MERREFSKTLVEAVASYALFHTLAARDAFGRDVRPITDRWLRDLQTMSLDLRDGRITPSEWQDQIDALYRNVPLHDLLLRVDFDRVVRGFDYPDRGVNTERVRFPALDGLPERLAFHSKVFGMQRDRAIIPHGHRNMVSCHYVLQGDLHLRHFDKVEEDATHMVIEPTVDAVARPGSYSSISDERNNVHWLRAMTETAFTFDVIVLDVGGGEWEVDNIDPYAAEHLGDGRLRAPKLDVATALKKYGLDAHH
ncbi:MAG: hypothetical protein ABJF88_15115 [Rhodothermales bacterium]